jgi:hypothetical protein
LDSIVIAKPRCAGRNSGQDEKNDLFAFDFFHEFGFFSTEYYQPSQNKHNAGAYSGSQIRVYVFDPDFCQNGSGGSEYGRKQGENEPCKFLTSVSAFNVGHQISADRNDGKEYKFQPPYLAFVGKKYYSEQDR